MAGPPPPAAAPIGRADAPRARGRRPPAETPASPIAPRSLALSLLLHAGLLIALVVGALRTTGPPGREGRQPGRLELALAPDDALPERTAEAWPIPDAAPPLPPPPVRPAPPLEALAEPLPEDEPLLLETVEVEARAPPLPALSLEVAARRLPRQRAAPTSAAAPPAPPPAAPPSRSTEAPTAVPPSRPRPAPAAPPRPAAEGRPAPPRDGGAGRPLRALHSPLDYPAAARRQSLEGRALVDLVVASDGSVVRVRLAATSGHPLLDAAALRSVARWRFAPPGRLRRVVLPVRFRLR